MISFLSSLLMKLAQQLSRQQTRHLLIKTSIPSLPPLAFMFLGLCFCTALLLLPKALLALVPF